VTTPPPIHAALDSVARISRASRSLKMAGRALDPNAACGPDLRLAELLLAHTLVAVAVVSSGDSGDDAQYSASDAIATLERSGLLARAAGNAGYGRSILAPFAEGGGGPGTGHDELVEAEVLLGKLLRLLRDETAIPRAMRWLRWGFALLCAAAVTAAMTPTFGRLARGRYKWTASSASFDFATSGRLWDHGASGLIFHSAFENAPWVSIDLLRTRSIHVVSITNRDDCCQQRCIPLVIEAAGDDGHFVEVARRKDAFSVWDAEFAPRRARYVRLRVEGQTFFHLREVEIH
jgi:hypothetical protein